MEKSDKEELEQAIKAANQAVEEASKLSDKIAAGKHPEPFYIEDMLTEYGGLLNEKTTEATKNLVKYLSFGHPEEDNYKAVRCLAKYANKEDETEVLKEIATFVNELADKGYLEGFLVPLSRLSLHINSPLSFPYAYFSYPLLNKEGVEYFDNHAPEEINADFVEAEDI